MENKLAPDPRYKTPPKPVKRWQARDYGALWPYAPTPQAKGKVERRHDDWQKRLVPLFAADRILDLTSANQLLDQLVPHANQHELHRQLGQTPHSAHQQALADKRSGIHPAPKCPW